MYQYLVGSAIDAALGGINQALAARQAQQDRLQNYYLGEQAAENADARTRALYNDFYSPSALMKQYKEAGLSPSMMFGGTPGQGGMAGAMGSAGGNLQTAYQPIGMQGAALLAQIQKTKAETANIEHDTNLKIIQEALNEMSKDLYQTEFTLLNTGFQMPDGSYASYYDIAGQHKDFDSFINACREASIQSGDQNITAALASEQGLKTMRAIYIARHEFNTELEQLSTDRLNAKFQREVIQALQSQDFPNQSAKEAVQRLKASIEMNSLTEDQKGAWTRLLDRIGEKGSTGRDIVVILSQIFMHQLQMKEDLAKAFL